MDSNIVLCTGEDVLCNTEYGESLSVPKAFITEEFAGIRLDEKQGNFVIQSLDTGSRSVLAAIRGTFLVQEVLKSNKHFDS